MMLYKNNILRADIRQRPTSRSVEVAVSCQLPDVTVKVVQVQSQILDNSRQFI